MYKIIIFLCLCLVVIEGRPRWQYLPEVPGYVPVYIRNGDTPLEEINPELAEAFHALPSGRSAGKQVEASEAIETEQGNIPEKPSYNDRRHEKKALEKKKKYENVRPAERR
ncbi:uncharacterized protein LOC116779024 [Danaus plexippus]|uniref:Gustatory receptor candidate 59 n=1 Tax=Danaus plexippus plexippus TaxID=278856 RepID=A0A212EL31_DANPL|nr:uncharacterized protein LOC116779024 [Danaus plexippus]OWR42177.1 putative gustatory receptor candidate 59 [Danaus plexippus plexippus]